MEVILLDKIRGLGNLGDLVDVKPGYGRNFLIPQGKAVPATKANRQKFEEERAEHERKAQEILKEAKTRADAISKLQIVIRAAVSDEGKLYGSVGNREISEAVTKMGVVLKKSEVQLTQGAFRQPGEFEVDLILHSDVTISVKISILPE